ncbi:hypothetical protein MMC06_001334 [Schaereria dolodes]|nr:hypothetical protein [Schaereria dolodes]
MNPRLRMLATTSSGGAIRDEDRAWATRVAGWQNSLKLPVPQFASMQPEYPQPLELSGCLEKYKSFLSTPCIGTEFPDVKLVDWLRAPNSDELLRDLAITIAQRGVVFFRAQTELDRELHKELITRLGHFNGRPKENGLYIQPLYKVLNAADPEVITLESVQIQAKTLGAGKSLESVEVKAKTQGAGKRQSGRAAWHSDTSFEKNPADLSSLRLTKMSKEGGDTLWASSYEVYDRFSEPFQRFLESLTATFLNRGHHPIARAHGQTIFEGPRGAPANVGLVLETNHPVVRTHPVTGWKCIFAGGVHCPQINDVTPDESEFILNKVMNIIMLNHDLQVRFQWKNPSDMAIWDNRCVFHAPTPDADGPRHGLRVLGMGEKPYLDPNSKSRREALAEKNAAMEAKKQEALVLAEREAASERNAASDVAKLEPTVEPVRAEEPDVGLSYFPVDGGEVRLQAKAFQASQRSETAVA